jgi:DNA-binding response OmpR family regulator
MNSQRTDDRWAATGTMPDRLARAQAPTQPLRQSVLLALASAEQRGQLASILQADGYCPLEAANGEAAWHWLTTRRPAVVVVDDRLPGCQPRAFVQTLKRHGGLPPSYVILLGEPPAIQNSEAGADCYLVQPCAPLELLRVVDRALGLGLALPQHPSDGSPRTRCR